MFNSAILDVVIGVAFVFMLVSTLCAAIREGLEAWLKTRSSYLEHAIRELLHDRTGLGLARAFYTHPMIASLYQDDYDVVAREKQAGKEAQAAKAGKKPKRSKPPLRGKNLPSYIPSRTFALALMDIAARGPVTDAASSDPTLGKVTFESLRASIAGLQNPPVQRILLNAFDTAENNLDSVRQNIEDWYNGSMDRVSGWYKRNTQIFVLCIAAAVVAGLNINTIVIVDHLYRDKTLRESVVAAAQKATDDGQPPSTAQEGSAYERASASLNGLSLPIGWERGWQLDAKKEYGQSAWNDIFGPIVGLVVTAIAAMLGAPFWFDVLNKIMVIRATVKPREKSQEEGSEDRASTTVRSKDRRPASPPPEPQRPSQPPAPQLRVPPAAAIAAPASSPPPPAAEDDVEHDSCSHLDEDGDDAKFTRDEDLPPAQGGVA